MQPAVLHIKGKALALGLFNTVAFISLFSTHVVFDQPFSDFRASSSCDEMHNYIQREANVTRPQSFPLFRASKCKKIYIVGDKQDAAALEPQRSWNPMSVFTGAVWGWAKSPELTLPQQLPLKTQTQLWQRAIRPTNLNKISICSSCTLKKKLIQSHSR